MNQVKQARVIIWLRRNNHADRRICAPGKKTQIKEFPRNSVFRRLGGEASFFPLWDFDGGKLDVLQGLRATICGLPVFWEKKTSRPCKNPEKMGRPRPNPELGGLVNGGVKVHDAPKRQRNPAMATKTRRRPPILGRTKAPGFFGLLEQEYFLLKHGNGAPVRCPASVSKRLIPRRMGPLRNYTGGRLQRPVRDRDVAPQRWVGKSKSLDPAWPSPPPGIKNHWRQNKSTPKVAQGAR